jgi:TDG/mug DNA glycosylase family protein
MKSKARLDASSAKSTAIPHCAGFPPVVEAGAHLLILGSMPGVPSLQAAQYYANPRNAFWWIAEQLWGVELSAAYDDRLAGLGKAKVALWDVLGQCQREGSLDSRIVAASEEAQPLAEFLAAHPSIQRVAFNGTKAMTAWKRHIVPAWPMAQPLPILIPLPSTSPAHAALSREQKLAVWRERLAT